jgi:hypothetical protein
VPDLIPTVLAGVETAFSVAEEFVRVGTYVKKSGNGTYDPVADTKVENTNRIENVRFLRTATTREEREASPIAIQDAKFIVPSVDIPDLDPGENDSIEFNDGTLEIWNVMVSKFVPGRVVHIVFARRA